MTYQVEDFIWVFPHDVENLSRKEPYLYQRQRYQPEDLLRELVHLYATQAFQSGAGPGGQGDLDVIGKKILSFLRDLLERVGEEKDSKVKVKAEQRVSLVTPHKTQTLESESDEEEEEVEEDKRPFGLPKELNEWIKTFETIFRPDRGRYLFRTDPKENESLGLLIVKPSVRGMIRAAHANIKVEANKDFTVQELMYSPDINTYFARFIAVMQGNQSLIIPSTRMNIPNLGDGTGNSLTTNGSVHIYNGRSSHFHIDLAKSEKTSGIEFFKNVFRVEYPGRPGVYILEYLGPLASRSRNRGGMDWESTGGSQSTSGSQSISLDEVNNNALRGPDWDALIPFQ
jgi:hypothetical protein